MREAATRVIGQRHYDVQLIGGCRPALRLGRRDEDRRGQDPHVDRCPSTSTASTGKGVHVVTVNDYLAARDAEWMGQIHGFLGLERRAHRPRQPRTAPTSATQYAADITYGTNNELGFDYLRDNMAMSHDRKVQRGHDYCIVDEIDSILIDEARTPLIISGRLADAAKIYYQFASIVAGSHRDAALRRRRGEAHGCPDRRGHPRGRAGARHREPLRRGPVEPRAPARGGPQGQGAVPPRQGLHRRQRRGEDRRRVHRAHPRGAALVRRAAPGGRGQRGRQDQRREPDARHDHAAELLPPLRQARRDDRHGARPRRPSSTAPTACTWCRSRPTSR